LLAEAVIGDEFQNRVQPDVKKFSFFWRIELGFLHSSSDKKHFMFQETDIGNK